MVTRIHEVRVGDGVPPPSLGPHSPAFQLWKFSELPEVWARDVEREQLAEAARQMEVPVDLLEAYTFVELPDCPWGRAYHQWASVELEKLPPATPPTHLPVLLSNLHDFRAAGRSEAEVLRCLLSTGRPPPYFGRAFGPSPVGWQGGIRA